MLLQSIADLLFNITLGCFPRYFLVSGKPKHTIRCDFPNSLIDKMQALPININLHENRRKIPVWRIKHIGQNIMNRIYIWIIIIITVFRKELK